MPRLSPILCLLVLSSAPATALTVKPVVAEGTLYTVATVTPGRDDLRLHWRNPTTSAPYATFAQLGARLN